MTSEKTRGAVWWDWLAMCAHHEPEWAKRDRWALPSVAALVRDALNGTLTRAEMIERGVPSELVGAADTVDRVLADTAAPRADDDA